jgi:hypothetical protein
MELAQERKWNQDNIGEDINQLPYDYSENLFGKLN